MPPPADSNQVLLQEANPVKSGQHPHPRIDTNMNEIDHTVAKFKYNNEHNIQSSKFLPDNIKSKHNESVNQLEELGNKIHEAFDQINNLIESEDPKDSNKIKELKTELEQLKNAFDSSSESLSKSELENLLLKLAYIFKQFGEEFSKSYNSLR